MALGIMTKDPNHVRGVLCFDCEQSLISDSCWSDLHGCIELDGDRPVDKQQPLGEVVACSHRYSHGSSILLVFIISEDQWGPDRCRLQQLTVFYIFIFVLARLNS